MPPAAAPRQPSPAGTLATAAPPHGRALRGCEVCRRWEGVALCADCLDRFAAPRPRCARCGLALGVAAPACGHCLREAPPFAATVCAFDYAFPWDRLIAEFKFNARPELARPLAQRLLQALNEAGAVEGAGLAGAARPDVLLPVPLAPARLAERGYNQAWELARELARALALPADATLLQRPADGAHQAQLTRDERRRNLRGAFLVDPLRRGELAGRHVALVDDVMTTGATLREAAVALLRAGAASVSAWVLARTPDD
ncbi:MAG: ComF family protein [Rubrivivax sp.]|nr:ComF family protein [Rubrivivax sp.]